MTKIIVHEIESITPGARHYWLRTNVGRIRKPIGALDLEHYDFSAIEHKIVFVEPCLLHWGRWLAKSTTGGLGYPKRSITEAALEGSRSTATHYYPDNPEAEEIEKFVKLLAKDHASWADVLRKHYTRADGETLAEVAKGMELPSSTYRYYLNMGRKKIEYALKYA